MDNIDVIKDCWFCGENNYSYSRKIDRGHEVFAVWCVECDCVGPYAPSMEDAIVLWNTRAVEDRLEKEIKQLWLENKQLKLERNCE